MDDFKDYKVLRVFERDITSDSLRIDIIMEDEAGCPYICTSEPISFDTRKKTKYGIFPGSTAAARHTALRYNDSSTSWTTLRMSDIMPLDTYREYHVSSVDVVKTFFNEPYIGLQIKARNGDDVAIVTGKTIVPTPPNFFHPKRLIIQDNEVYLQIDRQRHLLMDSAISEGRSVLLTSFGRVLPFSKNEIFFTIGTITGDEKYLAIGVPNKIFSRVLILLRDNNTAYREGNMFWFGDISIYADLQQEEN